jgi:hypothetical protein
MTGMGVAQMPVAVTDIDDTSRVTAKKGTRAAHFAMLVLSN